jgi:hypothetical protein
MHALRRKSTPKVRGGRVWRKNRWDSSGIAASRSRMSGRGWSFDLVESPAPRGFVHVVRPQDLRRFIAMMPEAPKLLEGVHTVALDGSRVGPWGIYYPGVITLCPWVRPRGGEWWFEVEGFAGSSDDLETGLNLERVDDTLRCPRKTAAPLALVEVFLHELGHHRDCRSTRRRRDCPRGEDYAEQFARRLRTEMWPSVQRLFAL